LAAELFTNFVGDWLECLPGAGDFAPVDVLLPGVRLDFVVLVTVLVLLETYKS